MVPPDADLKIGTRYLVTVKLSPATRESLGITDEQVYAHRYLCRRSMIYEGVDETHQHRVSHVFRDSEPIDWLEVLFAQWSLIDRQAFAAGQYTFVTSCDPPNVGEWRIQIYDGRFDAREETVAPRLT